MVVLYRRSRFAALLSVPTRRARTCGGDSTDGPQSIGCRPGADGGTTHC